MASRLLKDSGVYTCELVGKLELKGLEVSSSQAEEDGRLVKCRGIMT